MLNKLSVMFVALVVFGTVGLVSHFLRQPELATVTVEGGLDQAVLKTPARIAQTPATAVPADKGASAATGDRTVTIGAKNGCFSMSFQHKAIAGHQNRSDCSRHENAVPFALAGIAKESICVRVDGTPVQFRIEKDRLIAPAVAGPASTISVSYARGSSRCRQACDIPKDVFMDALTGDDRGSGRPGQPEQNETVETNAKWSAQDAEEDLNIVSELSAEVMGAMVEVGAQSMFEGWNYNNEVAINAGREEKR